MLDEDLSAKVRRWLEAQGYPLEMRTARELQLAGFDAMQSTYYFDPGSGHFREVDVVALVEREIGHIVARVTLVVECKSSRDKPWVLFVSDKLGISDATRITQRTGSTLAHYVLARIASHKSVQCLPIFELPNGSAYGMTQAFTGGADVCYAASMAVANASFQRIASDPAYNRDTAPRVMEVVFPVIVTDAQLFSATLEENSEMSLSNRSTGVLLWHNSARGPRTMIHVVSKSDLSTFARIAYQSATQLLHLCGGELRADFDAGRAEWEEMLSRPKIVYS